MKEIKEEYPDLDLSFTFGYSMEHPDLREAINFLKSIGSIQSEYLHCDGLRMRNEQECEELAGLMAEEGVRSLNFTFYGLKEYHDRFAGRNGDFDLMMQMMASAIKSGLNVSAGIPLTKENVATADELINVLKKTDATGSPCLFLTKKEEEQHSPMSDWKKMIYFCFRMNRNS